METLDDVRIDISENEFYVLQRDQLSEALKGYCDNHKIAPRVYLNDSWVSSNTCNRYFADNNIVPELVIM